MTIAEDKGEMAVGIELTEIFKREGNCLDCSICPPGVACKFHFQMLHDPATLGRFIVMRMRYRDGRLNETDVELKTKERVTVPEVKPETKEEDSNVDYDYYY